MQKSQGLGLFWLFTIAQQYLVQNISQQGQVADMSGCLEQEIGNMTNADFISILREKEKQNQSLRQQVSNL